MWFESDVEKSLFHACVGFVFFAVQKPIWIITGYAKSRNFAVRLWGENVLTKMAICKILDLM